MSVFWFSFWIKFSNYDNCQYASKFRLFSANKKNRGFLLCLLCYLAANLTETKALHFVMVFQNDIVRSAPMEALFGKSNRICDFTDNIFIRLRLTLSLLTLHPAKAGGFSVHWPLHLPTCASSVLHNLPERWFPYALRYLKFKMPREFSFLWFLSSLATFKSSIPMTWLSLTSFVDSL